jgi:hypothetical protein
VGRRGIIYLVIGLICALMPALGSAEPMLLLTQDPDARWTLISLPLSGAPLENESAQLLHSPIQLVSINTGITLLHSPADARWARMAHERMHILLTPLNEILYYPKPEQLPIYPENTTLER